MLKFLPDFEFIIGMIRVISFHEIEFGCFTFTAVKNFIFKTFAIFSNELCSFVNNSANFWRRNNYTSNFSLFSLQFSIIRFNI